MSSRHVALVFRRPSGRRRLLGSEGVGGENEEGESAGDKSTVKRRVTGKKNRIHYCNGMDDVGDKLDQNMKSMQELARKKNDEELDRICKNCCLVIGWLFVLGLFSYIIYLISIH